MRAPLHPATRPVLAAAFQAPPAPVVSDHYKCICYNGKHSKYNRIFKPKRRKYPLHAFPQDKDARRVHRIGGKKLHLAHILAGKDDTRGADFVKPLHGRLHIIGDIKLKPYF